MCPEDGEQVAEDPCAFTHPDPVLTVLVVETQREFVGSLRHHQAPFLLLLQ